MAGRVRRSTQRGTLILARSAGGGIENRERAARELARDVRAEFTPLSPGEWTRQMAREMGGMGKLALRLVGLPDTRESRSGKRYKAELRALERVAKEQHHGYSNRLTAADREAGFPGRRDRIAALGGRGNPYATPRDATAVFSVYGLWEISKDIRKREIRTSFFPRDDALDTMGARGGGIFPAVELAGAKFNASLVEPYRVRAQITFA